MITLYVIIGIALVAATAWVYTNPETRQELGEVTERTTSTVKALPEKVSHRFKDKREGALKGWLTGKSTVERQQYVQQAATSTDDFLKWADEMPAETARELNKHVRQLIEKMGLDLEWITDQKLAHYPVLKQELEESVVLTAQSYW